MKHFFLLFLPLFLASFYAFSQPLSDDELQFRKNFADAARYRMLGDSRKAIKAYEACLRSNKESAASLYFLGKLHLELEDIQQALYYTKNAVELSPKNRWYREFLLELYSSRANWEEGMPVLQSLVRDFPNNWKYKTRFFNFLVWKHDYKEALKLLKDMKSERGLSPELLNSELTVYDRLQQPKKIVSTLEEYLVVFPDDEKALGLLAESYSSVNEPVKAENTYLLMLGKNPNNGLARLSLISFYLSVGREAEAYENLLQVFANPTVDVKTKIRILSSNRSNVERVNNTAERTEALLQKMEQAEPDNPEVLAYRAEILFRMNRFDDSRILLRKSLKIKPDNYEVWLRLLDTEFRLADYKALYDESDNAISYYPNQPYLYWYRGFSAARLRYFKASKEALNTGLQMAFDIDTKAEFYLTLADMYNDAKQYEKSDGAFDALLRLQPNNLPALNNYSYYLAVRGEKLNLALEMAKKCISNNPSSSTFSDTYAWVLYHLEKYAEAKTEIERAIQLGDGTDADVIEHYGDILFRTGDTQAALQQWKLAENLGGKSASLKKKIKSGRVGE